MADTATKPAKATKAAKAAKAKPQAATTKAPAEPKPTKEQKAITSKLTQVERKGGRYSKVRTDVLDIRDGLDAAILDARKAGASYKEIAAAAKVSVSWVQTSLGRSGYQPVGRVRSNSDSAAAA